MRHTAASMATPPIAAERAEDPLSPAGADAVAGRRTRSRSHRPAVAALAAALLYLAYAVFITWPVVRDIDFYTYGTGGDLYGSIAVWREVVEERAFPFAPATLPDLNAPFGLDVAWVLNVATAPGTLLLYGLSSAFGAIAGHTIFVLGGYVASGLAMFLLARKLTGSAGAGLVAGLAFAFYPYAVNKGLSHIHFVHGWPFVLLLWRMLELTQAPTRRNGLLAGAAAALAMWFTPYYVLFAGVAFAALCAVAVAVGWGRKRLKPALAGVGWAGVPVVALLAGLLALEAAAGGSGSGEVRSHPLSQLVTYAARAHEFVVPDRNSALFGSATEPFLTDRLHGSNFSETSLYVGWSVLALTLVAVIVAIRALRRHGRAGATGPWLVAVLAAVVLVLTGVAFSAPPQLTVLGQLVPAPALLVHEVTGTWRVFSRFIVVVMLGLALLAAFGAARLLRGRGPVGAAILTTLLLAIVAVDLWARPPDSVVAMTMPAIDQRVPSTPSDAIVAGYPVVPAVVPDPTELVAQQAHGRPVLGGYPAGSSDESRKLELADLHDRQTAPTLAALGVRHVVVRNGYGLPTPRRGFRKVAEDPSGTLYAVTAAPARSGVDALNGFDPVEGPPNEQYRWLAHSEGRVVVWARCELCVGELEFGASSHEVARTLTVLDAGGRVLARREVPAQPWTVRVPLRFRRKTVLTFRITPGPGTVPVAANSTEVRPVGILMAEPRFVPTRQRPR